MISTKYSSDAEESILLIDKMIYQLSELKCKCSNHAIKQLELDNLGKSLESTKSQMIQAQESLKKLQEINSQTEKHNQEITKKTQEKNWLADEINQLDSQINQKRSIGDTYDNHVEMIEKLLEHNFNIQLICKELVSNPDYQEIIRRIEVLKSQEQKLESEKENVRIHYIESCKEIEDLKNLIDSNKNEIQQLKNQRLSTTEFKKERNQLLEVKINLQRKIEELQEQTEKIEFEINDLSERKSDSLKKEDNAVTIQNQILEKKSKIENLKERNKKDLEELELKTKAIQQENQNLKEISKELEKRIKIIHQNK